MKQLRRTLYATMLAYVLLSLGVRYPTTPHGVGVDSFLFDVLSGSILNQGHAAWIINPLSLFGVYPLSYPSGSFFLTASVVSTSGIHTELATLLASLIVGVLGIFTAFVMAREFWKNDLFAMSVALVFSLMPRFVTNTLWEVPTRGFLMALIPLFIWALLRSIRYPTMKNVALATCVFLLMSLFHRLAILMAVVLVALVLTLLFATVMKILSLHYPKAFMSPSFRARSRHLGLALYGTTLVASLLGSGVLGVYAEGAYFSGDNPAGTLGNLVVSLSRSVGILIPIAVIGVPVVLFKRNKSTPEYLYLSSPFAILPILFLRSYSGFYVVAFFALFIGMGCAYLSARLRGRVKALAVVALLVVVPVAAGGAIKLELPRISYMPSSDYNVGLYARYAVQGTIASNDGLLAVRVVAISGGACLPIGGATTATYGPDAMAFGFVHSFPVEPVPLWDLTTDSDSIFAPIGVTVGADWSVMMSHPIDPRSLQIAGQYHVTTILENSRQPAVYYTGWGVVYESPLLAGAYQERYKIYESDGVRLWALF